MDFFNFCWVFQKFSFFCITLYISSSGSPAVAAASPEHCVQMMGLRRGGLTKDEVWHWFVLPLHESFERKITSCMREPTDSRLFLYSRLVFHQDVPDNLKKSLSSIVFSSLSHRQMFRIPLDVPQGSVRETFFALISKFVIRLNGLFLLTTTRKKKTLLSLRFGMV